MQHIVDADFCGLPAIFVNPDQWCLFTIHMCYVHVKCFCFLAQPVLIKLWVIIEYLLQVEPSGEESLFPLDNVSFVNQRNKNSLIYINLLL